MTLKPTCVTHQDFILGRKKRTCHEIHEALLSVPCPLSSCHRNLHCDQMSNICAPRLTQLVLLPAPVPSLLCFQPRQYALSLQPTGPQATQAIRGHPGESTAQFVRFDGGWRGLAARMLPRVQSPLPLPLTPTTAEGAVSMATCTFLEQIFWNLYSGNSLLNSGRSPHGHWPDSISWVTLTSSKATATKILPR